MNTTQIEKNLKEIIGSFNKESFVYDLLMAYGISKTSITRLRKGDSNMSKLDGEVLYKKKVLFKEVDTDKLLTTIDDLTNTGEELRHNPRFVIVTDYTTLLAKDVRTSLTLDIPILEIDKHFHFFLPWAGQEKYQSKNENHADRRASEEMAKLYDILVHENPNIYADGGHNLNIFLSRILFCFFAEDTGIFDEDSIFTNTLAQHTKKDGSDVNLFLDRLFRKLRTEFDKEAPAYLTSFPYVNGGLFKDSIISPKFSSKARKIILDCGELNWSEINPDIFGSMIQAVVNPAYRSGLGMHYTSVPNIMKVIEPLFLNELKEEFEKSKGNSAKVRKLIYRLSKIKCFDPACGSGNFLIISYKELRKLEIEILQHLYEIEKQISIVFTEIKLSQFYGIELDDFAHEMAILSLWLAEHQMNKIFVDELHDFGRAKPILPLKEAGHITQGNATRIDWKMVCPVDENEEIYILGNPPYLGSFLQNKEQKEDLKIVSTGFKSYKDLDYIACWFIKSAIYSQNTKVSFAFVTTNSICQGEQVSLLWPFILSKELEIFFAYQSFKWSNNAKANAGVYCTIIGIKAKNNEKKKIFTDNLYASVDNINPYLTSGSSVILSKRSKPLSEIPVMSYGSKIVDNGHLIFSTEEKNELLQLYPDAEILFKKLAGSAEFIRNLDRWCLFVDESVLDFANSIPPIRHRFDLVSQFREKSTEVSTREMAKFPHKFYYSVHSDSNSIIIPRTSSERRQYIPMGFLDGNTIVSDAASVVFNAELWIFGILTSKIHMTWVRAVGGRLKTDYRYSSQLCYNTFPFPPISNKQKQQINLHVFEILDERAKYSEKTLAQLYDPDKMPSGLKEAHHQLDLAIERCYRLKPFENDVERLEYLFKMYEGMTTKDSLFLKEKKLKKKKA